MNFISGSTNKREVLKEMSVVKTKINVSKAGDEGKAGKVWKPQANRFETIAQFPKGMSTPRKKIFLSAGQDQAFRK